MRAGHLGYVAEAQGGNLAGVLKVALSAHHRVGMRPRRLTRTALRALPDANGMLWPRMGQNRRKQPSIVDPSPPHERHVNQFHSWASCKQRRGRTYHSVKSECLDLPS